MGLSTFMIETEVSFEQDSMPEISSDTVLVEGLPGVGLVAKAAIAYILDQLPSYKICRFHSAYFPSAGYIHDGKIVLNYIDLYYAPRPRGLLLLYGNSQPSTSFGQFDLCEKVIDVATKFRCKLVITLGGYGKEEVGEKREIHCSSSNNSTFKEYLKRVDGLPFSGQIVGAAGLLVTLASSRSLDNFSMLIETRELAPDFYAAQRALEALRNLIQVDLPLRGVEEISKAYMSAVSKYETT